MYYVLFVTRKCNKGVWKVREFTYSLEKSGKLREFRQSQWSRGTFLKTANFEKVVRVRQNRSKFVDKRIETRGKSWQRVRENSKYVRKKCWFLCLKFGRYHLDIFLLWQRKIALINLQKIIGGKTWINPRLCTTHFDFITLKFLWLHNPSL